MTLLDWQDLKFVMQNFQILDADDQLRLVKRVLVSLNIDEKKWPARQAVWWINSKKDEGLRPHSIEDYGDLYLKTHLSIYRAYEEACQRGGMVDFGELLLRAHEMWLHNPDLLKHYQERFNALLVDEFQDTNTIQYAWIRVLAGDQNNIMVVGDDDQSIYGWRGAKIENIQQFTNDFPRAETVRLEQNYRSTSNILKAANGLIDQNLGRLGKELWTDFGDGDAIQLYAGYNEVDEARFIVERVKRSVDEGNLYSENAILYRSNAQSRVLEEALLRSQMPYRIYGGQRFFERAEIRNVLAYMRLISNRDADAAFERVINTPTRGIGEKSVAEIRGLARASGVSLWQAANAIVGEQLLSSRARKAIAGFVDLMTELDDLTTTAELAEVAEVVIEKSGLKEYHAKEGGERGQARVENMSELVTAAKTFDPNSDYTFDTNMDAPTVELSLLDEFLNHAALEAGEGQGDPNQDCVQLMTMHSAKGLEFQTVFLSGMEDGLFPHMMSMEEEGRLEEERRLCYVGVTRAMRRLYLTYAESRRINGSETFNRQSRFINEMPHDVIEEVRLSGTVVRPAAVYGGQAPIARQAHEVTGTDLKLGQRVLHQKFGEGVIVNYEGEGTGARVQVNFDEGSKWLVMAYANLEPVG